MAATSVLSGCGALAASPNEPVAPAAADGDVSGGLAGDETVEDRGRRSSGEQGLEERAAEGGDGDAGYDGEAGNDGDSGREDASSDAGADRSGVPEPVLSPASSTEEAVGTTAAELAALHRADCAGKVAEFDRRHDDGSFDWDALEAHWDRVVEDEEERDNIWFEPTPFDGSVADPAESPELASLPPSFVLEAVGDLELLVAVENCDRFGYADLWGSEDAE